MKVLLIMLLVCNVCSGVEFMDGKVETDIKEDVLLIDFRRKIKEDYLLDHYAFAQCRLISKDGKSVSKFYALLEASTVDAKIFLYTVSTKKGGEIKSFLVQIIGRYLTTSGKIVPIYEIKDYYDM